MRLLFYVTSQIFNTMAKCEAKFHTSSISNRIFHENRRSGQPPKIDGVQKELTFKEKLREVKTLLKDETTLIKDELTDFVYMDPNFVIENREVDVVWRFNKDPACLDKWVVTNDSDYNLGYSTSSIQLDANGKGVFSGVVDTRVIKTGKVERSGFCNITTVKEKKSFLRVKKHNWFDYTHLVLRVRGDGRPYLINLLTPGYFDVLWNDVYSYILHTRGGPYWQVVEIPFAKFFLTAKGRIQDAQSRINLLNIERFGITVGKIPGPFKLEIDYVGVMNDCAFEEECAYELYKQDMIIR